MERLRAILEKPNGLFIVAGPAFSKTNETLVRPDEHADQRNGSPPWKTM